MFIRLTQLKVKYGLQVFAALVSHGCVMCVQNVERMEWKHSHHALLLQTKQTGSWNQLNQLVFITDLIATDGTVEVEKITIDFTLLQLDTTPDTRLHIKLKLDERCQLPDIIVIKPSD